MKQSLIASSILLFQLGLTSCKSENRLQADPLEDRLTPFASIGEVYSSDNIESMRPRIMGREGVVATGHFAATAAGIDVLKAGGNAFDAGITASMALKAVKMDLGGWTGIAPLILYSASEDAVITRSGVGTAPKAATLEYYKKHGKTPMNTALVPADIDVWLATLDRFGTLSFAEAAAPTLRLTEEGYHVYKLQRAMVGWNLEGIRKNPSTAAFWMQNGEGTPALGDVLVNADLGRLIRHMMAAEEEALKNGGSRSDGLQAARDAFYKGEPARAASEFYAKHGGIITAEDFAGYRGEWSEPIHSTFRGYDIHACDGWTQGGVFILMANLLESFDIEELGYNTPEYIHLLSQVIDLAFADSHQYLGDPDFTQVPEGLFSKGYAKNRASLIDMNRAFSKVPPCGDPAAMKASADVQNSKTVPDNKVPVMDTSSLSVMDAAGNAFSMTVSDGHLKTPLIPGWGFGIGSRGGQFNLDPSLANVVAPGKRPRNTNMPLMIMKDGKPFMAISTPGSEQQPQAMLQVLLNVIVWGMSPEQAVDQPRFGSLNYIVAGGTRAKKAGHLVLEDRIPAATFAALEKLGHEVDSWGAWCWSAGAVTVTWKDAETGLLIGAGDVRRETSALGY